MNAAWQKKLLQTFAFAKPHQGATLNLNKEDILWYMNKQESGLASNLELSHRSVLSNADTANDKQLEEGQVNKGEGHKQK